MGITNLPEKTSLAASGRHLSRFEERQYTPHPTALFALSLMQCERPLQISRVKNIGNVLEYSGVTFRLAQLMVGFLFITLDSWILSLVSYRVLEVKALSHSGVPISYELTTDTGLPSDQFAIDPRTGVIDLLHSLDYETDPVEYHLRVKAIENRRHPVNSIVNVRSLIKGQLGPKFSLLPVHFTVRMHCRDRHFIFQIIGMSHRHRLFKSLFGKTS